MVRAPAGSPRSRAARLAIAVALGALAGDVHAAWISVQSGAIVLGRTQSAIVQIGVDEPPGTEDRPLRLAVNVGAFSEPTRIGPGKYKAIYVPPPERYPQVALVAVWRETGPDARIDFLRIPLFGSTSIPVKGRPGASVTIQTPFQTFGPVKIDRKGEASVPIVVPPNVREVTAVVQDPGVQGATKRSVALEVPHYNRLTAALVPNAIQADGKDQVKLHVFYDLDGGGKAPDKVSVQATSGAAVFEGPLNGRFLYRYVPPQGESAEEVKFAVTIEGDLSARARAKVKLGLPAPARVVVRPPATSLPPGSKARAPISVLVMSAEGLGLPAEVDVTANGTPIGKARAKGNGAYEIDWTPPPEYPGGGLVLFRATAVDVRGRSASGAAHYQLSAAPVPKTVLASFDPKLVPVDGRTHATVALEVRDAAGNPLEKAQLLAVASDGAVGELVPRGGGRYEASYLAPSRSPGDAANLRVVDAGGNFEQRFPLPLRENPRRFLLGARVGYTHGLSDLGAPHVGLDAWTPLRVGDVWLGAGLSATVARARQTVTDPATSLTSESEVTWSPISLRLGWEAYASRRLSLVLGGGGSATYASYRSTLVSGSATATGFGGFGFVGLGYALGPGQLFGEASYGVSRVSNDTLRLDGGGVTLDLGYRFGVF